MTDRELMQKALETFEAYASVHQWVNARSLEVMYALRDRLAQSPQVRTTTPEHIEKIKSKWVELTDDEGADIWGDAHDIDWKRLVTPKEIVQRISDKLKEKNT
jgi:hypothetical protein